MKRFIILLSLVLFSGSVFAKTVTIDRNLYAFEDALVNQSVNSIILKTNKYNKESLSNFGYYYNLPSALNRKLSISGSVNPFGYDNFGNFSSSLYLILQNPIKVANYSFSLKNIALSNYATITDNTTGESKNESFELPCFVAVSNGSTLSLSNVLMQTDEKHNAPFVLNNGTVNVLSNLYFFNSEKSLTDVENDGVLNFLGGTSRFSKGVNGDGSINVKGGKVVFDSSASLTQDKVTVSKGSLSVRPDKLQVNSIVNNAKNGLVFAYDDTYKKDVVEYVKGNEKTVTKTYYTVESLKDVTLTNAKISGKGSVSINCNVILGEGSEISQTINIPKMIKTTIEKQTVDDSIYYYNIYDFKVVNGEKVLQCVKQHASFEEVQKYKDYVYSEIYVNEESKDDPYNPKEQTKEIDVEVLKDNTNSLTANADQIKGVVNNNSTLNLTGGEITKAINGKGTTNILGHITNKAKINQDISIENTDTYDYDENGVQYVIKGERYSLTTNADLIKKGVDVFNNGELHLTGGNIRFIIECPGTTYIDGKVGNQAFIRNGSLYVSESGKFVTNASLLNFYVPGFEEKGSRTITNKGIIQLSSGTLSNVNVISSNGKDEGYDVTTGKVQIIGKVKISPVEYNIVRDENGKKISSSFHTPTIYQYIDIDKKGNLTTSADALKGNVLNYGTLNLTGGRLQIENTLARQFAVQNSKTMTMTGVDVKSDIDNYSKLTVKDCVIGTEDEAGLPLIDIENEDGSIVKNAELIYNSGKMTFTTSKNGKNLVSNVKGLAIKNEGKATLTVNGNATFKNNENTLGGVIQNVATAQGVPTINLIGKASKYSDYSFEGNSANNGGAIWNNGGIVNINSYYFRKNTGSNGGVLYNDKNSNYKNSKMTVKNSYFYENSTKEGGMGGVVYNNGGTYIDNGSTYASNRSDFGGAIYNIGTMQLKNTFFKDNGSNVPKTIYDGKGGSTTEPQFTASQGGAIFNNGDLVVFGSTFGAISHIYRYYIMSKDGKDILGVEDIEDVSALSFSPNSNRRPAVEVINLGNRAEKGGAIYNLKNATISDSDFEYNEANLGGAIYNEGKLTVSKNSTFTSNVAKENGGAIYTKTEGDTSVNIQKSKFYSNTAKDGGAIYVDSGNVTINGCTIGAMYHDGNDATRGGGIYNAGNDTKVVSTTFANNSAQKGGDIYNTGTITISKSYFGYVPKTKKGEYVILREYYPLRDLYQTYKPEDLENIAFKDQNNVWRPVIWYFRPSDIDTYSDFIGSVAEEGGAIYNTGKVVITSSSFNSSGAVLGGAIYNAVKGTVNINKSTFTNNSAKNRIKTTYVRDESPSEEPITVSEKENSEFPVLEDVKWKPVEEIVWIGDNKGGAIYNAGMLTVSGSTFKNNSAEKPKNSEYDGYGGAIYNEGTAEITSSTFQSNTAPNGGAIYNSGVMKIVGSTFKSNKADNGGAIYLAKDSEMYIQDTSFTNNIAEVAGGAIFMDENSVLSIAAVKKNVVFSGNKANRESNSIHMSEGSFLNLGALKGRSIIIKDKISAEGKATIRKWGKGNITIVDEKNMDNLIFDIKDGGQLDIDNGKVGTVFLKALNLVKDTDVAMNFSLKNATSDKIQTESGTTTGGGTLTISDVNITTNSRTPVTIDVGKDSIVNSISTKKAESAEATYKLKSYYDENGLLRVVAYGQKAKPAVLAAPVAAQIGGYLTQINSYDQAFMNMDMNMLKTREERQAETMRNQYALSTAGYSDFNESDNTISYNSKGLWNRPYATFERVNLNNGPKVSNIGYGNYFGGDADMKTLKNGWKRQFSAYIGYNGSVQDYNSQSIDQNGGTVGVTEVWYKNNFFTGLTLNAGANVAQASTDLGRENMPMFMTGIASKSGYNFEFKEGKFIVQPSILLSYSFIHTFSHDNGKGSHVGSSPLNAIQVAPGIKFIANLKNGWQPYLGVNMRWNIIDKTHFSLQDVNIPDMSIDPYVEYGIGLQRRWGERFTGFGQAMIRNGGRNGVMLSFGFKWLVGR